MQRALPLVGCFSLWKRTYLEAHAFPACVRRFSRYLFAWCNYFRNQYQVSKSNVFNRCRILVRYRSTRGCKTSASPLSSCFTDEYWLPKLCRALWVGVSVIVITTAWIGYTWLYLRRIDIAVHFIFFLSPRMTITLSCVVDSSNAVETESAKDSSNVTSYETMYLSDSISYTLYPFLWVVDQTAFSRTWVELLDFRFWSELPEFWCKHS